MGLASSSIVLASSCTCPASTSTGLAYSSISLVSTSTGLASSSVVLVSSFKGSASSSTGLVSSSTSLVSSSMGLASSSIVMASSCTSSTSSSIGLDSSSTDSNSKAGSTEMEGTSCTLSFRTVSSRFTSSVVWISSKEFITSTSGTSGDCAAAVVCEDSIKLSSIPISADALDSLSGMKSSRITGGEDSTVISSVFVSADSESASKSPKSIRGVHATSVSSGSDEICSIPSVVFGCSSTFSEGVIASIEISSSWSGAAAKGSNDEISIRFSP